MHDYSIPVDDMDNHLGTWSLLRLFPTFSCNRPPDNRITHAAGGKGDRPLVIQCQDSKKEPHHFTQWANKLAFNYRFSRLCLRHSRLKRHTQLSSFTHTHTALDSLISSNIPVISILINNATTPVFIPSNAPSFKAQVKMSDQAFSAQLFEVDRVANSHSDIELHRSRVLLAYSEGLVLFSRERLQSLKLQIEEYRRTRAAGFVIHVNDLEGNHADLPVLSGHVSSPVDGNFDLERVL